MAAWDLDEPTRRELGRLSPESISVALEAHGVERSISMMILNYMRLHEASDLTGGDTPNQALVRNVQMYHGLRRIHDEMRRGLKDCYESYCEDLRQ